MKPITHTIIEYQSFGVDEIAQAWIKQDKLINKSQTPSDEKDKQEKSITAKAENFFQALEKFAKGKNNGRFLKYHGKTKLKAQNHAGIIQTKHGTLEILPKCFRGDFLTSRTPTDEEKTNLKKNKKTSKENLKKFFAFENFEKQLDFENQLDSKAPKIQDFSLFDTPKHSAQNFLFFCLKSLKNSLFKSSNPSSLNTTYTPLLEIFMQMFCQELLEVCKKGIRHDYVAIEDNRTYLKGKLLFDGQIRHNLVHKERFYTSSDEYIADIAPNRLIKSTLKLISTLSTSHSTHTLINQSLEIFEEIPSSGNIQRDFLSCTTSRHFVYYDNILKWCELFLQNKSFTAFSGESEAYALLFPMEKLFESYVAYMFKKSNANQRIHTQSSSQFLLHTEDCNDSKLFQLKPDLLFELRGRKIIADTKWKPLKNAEDKKHGIAQSDLYQLFAYAHYHEAQEVWLIYPKLYAQSEDEKEEIKNLIDNLKEWNDKTPHYCHPCTFEDSLLNPHKIKLKVFFAPLAFH